MYISRRAFYRVLALLLMLLHSACEAPKNASELVAEAEQHAAAGQIDLAIAAASRAIALEPGDGQLRLRLAQFYLLRENGSLAEATARQAMDRGAPAPAATEIIFEALLQQQKYNEVIQSRVNPNYPPETRLALNWVRTRALALRPNSASDDPELTAAYVAILEKAAALPRAGVTERIRTSLQSARGSSAEADRAWQHFHCHDIEPEVIRWAPLAAGERRILRVGPQRDYPTPAAAAVAANDGDLVEIDEGTYAGGVALWPQNDLLVRGVGAGAVITADGRGIEGRDVWLFKGDDVVVENVEISGARSRYANGAAIRHIGTNLTLRNVYLHGNENGLLTGNRKPDSVIRIVHSEFAGNGNPEGKAHNIYVGRVARLEMRFSYSHSVSAGHLLKTRAQSNQIEYNRLSDDEGGQSSYLIDIPEGGVALVIGNVIEQGYGTHNHAMISFAGESQPHDENRIVIASNTFYNRHLGAIVLRNRAGADAFIANNLLAGAETTFSDGGAERSGNLFHAEHGLTEPRSFDFSLLAGARAIDAGHDVGVVPRFEYLHPRSGRSRRAVYKLDVGAYERCGL